jgi:hypothetical protein
MWWWVHEFFSGPSPEPLWYSPRPLTLPNGRTMYPLSVEDDQVPDRPDPETVGDAA